MKKVKKVYRLVSLKSLAHTRQNSINTHRKDDIVSIDNSVNSLINFMVLVFNKFVYLYFNIRYFLVFI